MLLIFNLLSGATVTADARTVTSLPIRALGSQPYIITRTVLPKSIQGNGDTYSAPTVSTFETLAEIKDTSKRSKDLYGLRVPFQDEDGYLALFFSNITATPFCKGVSEMLYEDSAKVFLDLNIKLHNAKTKIPVREDWAIEFCQKVRNNEGFGDIIPTSKASNRPSGTAKNPSSGATSTDGETASTTFQSSMKPTKADKSTTPKPTSATPPGDDAKPLEAATEAQGKAVQTKTAASTKLTSRTKMSSYTITRTLTNLETQRETFTIDVKSVKSSAESTSEVMPETSRAEAVETISTSIRKPDSNGDGTTPTSDDPTSTSKVEEPQVSVTDVASLLTSARTASTNVKVAEIGHQMTVPHLTVSSINTWYDYINKYMASATPKPNGAAVRARTWESKGERRVEVLGAGLWSRAKRLRQENDENEDDGGASRVPAPHRPTPSSHCLSAAHSITPPTATRRPATSADRDANADLTTSPSTTTSKPSATKSAQAAKTTTSIPDLDMIDFSFPSSTMSSAPHPSPSSSSRPSKENLPTTPSHEQASSAFGEIYDPRMRWTVELLLAIAVLQILCGIWEFWKSARGKVHVDLVGRWEVWDGKIATAE